MENEGQNDKLFIVKTTKNCKNRQSNSLIKVCTIASIPDQPQPPPILH